MRQHFDLFNDRFSERNEREMKRLQQMAKEQEQIDRAEQENGVKSAASIDSSNGPDINRI